MYSYTSPNAPRPLVSATAPLLHSHSHSPLTVRMLICSIVIITPYRWHTQAHARSAVVLRGDPNVDLSMDPPYVYISGLRTLLPDTVGHFDCRVCTNTALSLNPLSGVAPEAPSCLLLLLPQILDFSRTVHEDLSNFDPAGAWAWILDEFVESLRAQRSICCRCVCMCVCVCRGG